MWAPVQFVKNPVGDTGCGESINMKYLRQGNGVITSSSFTIPVGTTGYGESINMNFSAPSYTIPVGTTGCRESINMNFMCRSRKGTAWSPVPKKDSHSGIDPNPILVTTRRCDHQPTKHKRNGFTYLPCGVHTRPWLQTKRVAHKKSIHIFATRCAHQTMVTTQGFFTYRG